MIKLVEEKEEVKKNITDFSEDEIYKFVDSMDMNPVNKFLTDLVGLDVNLQKLKSQHRGIENSIKLKDQTNFIDHSKLLAAAWRNFNIGSFNSRIVFDKIIEKLRYWATIDFLYESHDGGSNGVQIADIDYTDGKWTFEPSKR